MDSSYFYNIHSNLIHSSANHEDSTPTITNESNPLAITQDNESMDLEHDLSDDEFEIPSNSSVPFVLSPPPVFSLPVSPQPPRPPQSPPSQIATMYDSPNGTSTIIYNKYQQKINGKLHIIAIKLFRKTETQNLTKVIFVIDPTKCDELLLQALKQQESHVITNSHANMTQKTGVPEMTIKLHSHTNSTKLISLNESAITITKETSFSPHNNHIVTLYEHNYDVSNIIIIPNKTPQREYITLLEMQNLTRLTPLDIIINLQPSYHGIFQPDKKTLVIHDTLKIVGMQIIRNDIMEALANSKKDKLLPKKNNLPPSKRMKIVNNIVAILARHKE